MDTAPKLDSSQAYRMFSAIYQEGDWFHLLLYSEKGVAPEDHDSWLCQRLRERAPFRMQAKMHQDPNNRERGLRYTNDKRTLDAWLSPYWAWNENCKLAIAASIPVYEQGCRRLAKSAVGLSAFAIDIDDKDFHRLLPAAASVEEIVPEVRRRLDLIGLRPHALVHSGHGLHVYILIQRQGLSTDADRQRAKMVWGQLCDVLGGARDRHDLGSVLRVPGTINWKNNQPVAVRFIDDALDRERYTFDQVAEAVAHVPVPATAKQKRKSREPGSSAGTSRPLGEMSPWSRHVLNIALKLDKGTAKRREASHVGSCADRSKADFAYACDLLRMGFPITEIEAEIAASSKGRERKSEYSSSTILAAAAEVMDTQNIGKAVSYAMFSGAEQAVYTIIERKVSKDGVVQNSVVAPLLGIVSARPGDGKTRSIIHELAQRVGMSTGRVGFCSLFVREILRHEYAINDLFPEGLWQYTQDGEIGAYNEHSSKRPQTHDELCQQLPEPIRQLSSEPGRPIWADLVGVTLVPSARLEQIKDPAAFWLNLHHPKDSDRARFPNYEEDDDGNLTPPPWFNEKHPARPRAVAKFGPRADLCAMGYDDKVLLGPHRPCAGCPIAACRANANGAAGGAKIDWKSAKFPLLTHAAYWIQGLHKPEQNHFDALVFDELPAQVYRLPTIALKLKPRSHSWSVHPITELIEYLNTQLSKLDEQRLLAEDSDKPTIEERRATTCAVANALSRARERLVRVASKHKCTKEASDKSKDFKYYRLEGSFAPILTSEEFERLRKLCKKLTHMADGNDDDADVESAFDLNSALMVLRDFSGDAPFPVFQEHDFSSAKQRSKHMWIRRPVDGWSEILTNPDGRARPTVVLDASAGIDPRYLLLKPSAEEVAPEAEFPNTTIVLTDKHTRSRSKQRRAVEQDATAEAKAIAEAVMPYMDGLGRPTIIDEHGVHPHSSKLLIVTEKEESRTRLEPEIKRLVAQGELPPITTVVHFGALRGRNDFDNYDAIYFTHLHRHHEPNYLGLALLLSGFEHMPKQWEFATHFKQGQKEGTSWVKQPNKLWKLAEYIRVRWMVCDIYQDALRIGIRRNPNRKAFIFLPTSEAPFITRLLRLFRGAKLALEPAGEELLASSCEPDCPCCHEGPDIEYRAPPFREEPMNIPVRPNIRSYFYGGGKRTT